MTDGGTGKTGQGTFQLITAEDHKEAEKFSSLNTTNQLI